MNRFLSIFGFFRHGRAEPASMRNDPFLLFRAFAHNLFEAEELEAHIHAPAMLARWDRESGPSGNGLRLHWAVSSEGGHES